MYMHTYISTSYTRTTHLHTHHIYAHRIHTQALKHLLVLAPACTQTCSHINTCTHTHTRANTMITHTHTLHNTSTQHTTHTHTHVCMCMCMCKCTNDKDVMTGVQAFDQLIKFSKGWDRDSGVLHSCMKFGNKIISSFIKIVPSLHRCFKTQQVLLVYACAFMLCVHVYCVYADLSYADLS